MRQGVPIRGVRARAFRVPTDAPEADGTLAWQATTLVLVEVEAGQQVGIGWSYTDAGAAALVREVLAPVLHQRDALAVRARAVAMDRAVRNLGRSGVAATALSAVDVALWDLKAKLLGLPLFRLLDPAREAVPLYGSGGFTTYDRERVLAQLGGWVEAGLGAVKMKVGRDLDRDLDLLSAARDAIGQEVALMVDANGAFRPKEALAFAERAAEAGVRWFEEPVSSDDLDGLRLLRQRAPASMEIAAGEYGYVLPDFLRLVGAVDVLQADATRCHGLTGFLRVSALCEAHGLALSAHTAPALHLHVALAAPTLLHVEWFYDHVRIERMLFEGLPEPRDGVLRPDPSRPGLGLDFRHADAARFAL